jgi:hypothetical protein
MFYFGIMKITNQQQEIMTANMFPTICDRINYMYNSLIQDGHETRNDMETMLTDLTDIHDINKLVALYQYHEQKFIKPFDELFNPDMFEHIILFMEIELLSREYETEQSINELRELYRYTFPVNQNNEQNSNMAYEYAFFLNRLSQLYDEEYYNNLQNP